MHLRCFTKHRGSDHASLCIICASMSQCCRAVAAIHCISFTWFSKPICSAFTRQNDCRAEEHLEADQAAAAKDALDLCLYQVTHHLAKAIQKVVVVAGQEAYPSWSRFAAAFAERGGVIEACASGMPADRFAEGTICCALLYFCSNSLFLAVLCCDVLCCAVP